MKRSRQVVLTSLLVVSAGLLVAASTLYLQPARAAVGPLPAEGLALPASTRFVGGIDMKRFIASPLYRKWATTMGPTRPETFRELEEKTGLNPERDVDLLLVAQAEAGSAIVMVKGRFERYALSRAIETRSGVTSKKHEGATVYLFREGSRGSQGVAFLDDETLLMGSQAALESTLTNRAQGRAALRENQMLVGLLERVRPGSTFWMVGDQSLLAHMPGSIPWPPSESKGSSSVQLPALRSLVVTGDLDPLLTVEATAEAADEPAAKNLADVARGLVALISLQAQQRPELQGLTSAVSVTTEGSRVHVNARLPYEVFDALRPTRRAPAPQAGR